MSTMKKDTVLYFFMLFLAVCVLLLSVAVGQISPNLYYRFENTVAPTIGSGNISGGGTTYVNGQVGKALSLTSSTNLLSGGSVSASASVTMEFLYRPSYDFDKTDYATLINIGPASFSISFHTILWRTKPCNNNQCNDDLLVTLDGINQKAYQAWNDSTWHHVVCTYDGSTGTRTIYLNGVLCFQNKSSASTFAGGGLLMNNNTSYAKYNGYVDEVAIYGAVMSPNQVYQHYLDVNSGNKYSFTLNASRPSSPTLTAKNDSNYYGVGHTPGITNSSDYTYSHLQQLQKFPLPRYARYNSHLNQRNFNWFDPSYQAGRGMNGVTAANIAASRSIQEEMYKKWNYGVMAIVNANVSGDGFTTESIDLANDNSSWTCDVITNYAFSSTYLTNQGYSTSKYLTNNSGGWLGPDGPAVVVCCPSRTVKYLNIYSPSSPMTDSVPKDGRAIAQRFRNNWTSLTNSIDRISENNEVIPVFTEKALKLSTALVADQAASGLTWQQWIGAGYKRAHMPYRDSVISATGAQFLQYSVDGQEDFRAKWSYMRDVQSTINNDKYSTADFYPRWPSNWEHWNSAWHGWDWMAASRRKEFASGDSLCAPFVSAGWDANPEVDINPAMWLGLLKCVTGLGVDFFHGAYFTLGNPGDPINSNPKGWAWQVAAASYAQAINTHMPYYMSSKILEGDVPIDYAAPSLSRYSYYGGDKRKLTVVRKYGTDKYMIYSTINGFSNQKGHVEDSAMCQIQLPGISNPIKFYTRPQGSVYYYDAGTSVFFQLDKWHENKHPDRWATSSFTIEAELQDTISFKLATYDNTSTDYRTFTTCAYLESGDTARYQFQPRTAGTYYLWVKAKRTSGGSGHLYVLSKTDTFDIGCVTGSTFVNYNKDYCTGQPISFTYPADTGLFRVVSDHSSQMIDFFYFTTTANAMAASSACNSSATTIVPSPNDTCTDCTITLDASTHTTYLWSTGATTATIDVESIGMNTYTVSVTDGSCTSSGTISVLIYPGTPPTCEIDASGSTEFCDGNDVYLTATSNLAITSTLWSTGSTDEQIRVQISGTYTVTVTTASGTATASQQVTSNGNPSVTILNGCPKYACTGTTTLTAQPNETCTYLWSNSQTSQTITADSGTVYTVTVTNSDGCTDTYSCFVMSCNSCALPTDLKVTKLTYSDSGYVNCTAKINWKCTTTPDRFVIEVVNLNGNTWYRSVPGTQKYIYLAGLREGKTYKVRVQSNCIYYESPMTDYIYVVGPKCK